MFGIGFSQFLLIALVALIVIGPERLPKVARSMGVLFGRAQRFAREVKAQVEQDLHLEELKQAKQDAENSLRTVEHSIQEQALGVEKQAQEVSRSVEIELQTAAEALNTSPSGNLSQASNPADPNASSPPVPQASHNKP